jgi:UDP-N-acetylglucosamine 2-epimerase (non-hydrolysing)
MNRKTNVTLVVGTRPNFIKAAPLLEALSLNTKFSPRLIHTGQHFDTSMSKLIFENLGMPAPDVFLGAGNTVPSLQIAEVMTALHKEFVKQRPELVLVFGDVNSTLAGALVANKMNIPLGHVEAGLRSFDRRMPEEHNRIVTDMLSDLLFTPSEDADDNLSRESIPASRIHRVGNIMVDSLLRVKPKAEKIEAWKRFNVSPGEYLLVTLHRPANVDEPEALGELVGALKEIGKTVPVIFPVHPRTRREMAKGSFEQVLVRARVHLSKPIGYLEFLNLMINAKMVLTDSGGIQEETTVLGIPCLTARENTERPITISQGTNQLVGVTKASILLGFKKAFTKRVAISDPPALWDGKTSERIASILQRL